MEADVISAVAAVSAVAVSGINLALSVVFVRKREARQWRRERLPELIEQFMRAALTAQVASDKDSVELSAGGGAAGIDELYELSLLLVQLEVYASPATTVAASGLLKVIEDVRQESHSAAQEGRPADNGRDRYWGTYWAFQLKAHEFLAAARREMGLEPPVMSSQLASRVAMEDGLAC